MNKNKLKISEFLKNLNKDVDDINKYRWGNRKIEVEKLDCKKLAAEIGVTPATISNANEDSKFSLLYNIAEVIYCCYQNYFWHLTKEEYKEYGGEEPTTIYNVLWVLGRITDHY